MLIGMLGVPFADYFRPAVARTVKNLTRVATIVIKEDTRVNRSPVLKLHLVWAIDRCLEVCQLILRVYSR